MDQEEETSIGGSNHSAKSLVASVDLASSSSKTTSTTTGNNNDNNIVSPDDSASRFEMTSQAAPQQPRRSISATNSSSSSRSTNTNTDTSTTSSSGSYSLDQFACEGDDQYVNQNSMVLEDLGYGDAAPDVAKHYHNNKSNLKQQQQPPMLVPRRSSLKGSSSGTSPNQQQRRGVGRAASMGCGASTMMEVRIRGERFPVQRRRSIVFASEVEIQEVEPVSSLVDSFSELWLTADDFVEMKQNRRHVVKQHKLRGQKAKYAAAAANAANAKSPPPDSSPPPSSSSPDGTTKKNAPRSPLPPAPPLTESANSQHSAKSEESSEELDEENYSLRGLEKYMDKSIRLQKNMAWDAVLLEQDEQELAGHYNPYRIADLYKHTTYQSPEKAVERAQQDQADIQEYLMSPRTKKLMMRRLSC